MAQIVDKILSLNDLYLTSAPRVLIICIAGFVFYYFYLLNFIY